MALHQSGEDYLEAILMLQKEKGVVRSVDVARHMDVSKPSVCHAENFTGNRFQRRKQLPRNPDTVNRPVPRPAYQILILRVFFAAVRSDPAPGKSAVS